MAKYFLEIKQSAQKEMDALDDARFARIDRKILSLAGNPRWRVGIGDWRVLHTIDDSAKLVTVARIAHAHSFGSAPTETQQTSTTGTPIS